MDINQFARAAIGVPFLKDGRDYNAWDCWGLVKCAYKDVLGVDLPNYTFGSVKHLMRQFTNRECSLWTPCEPQPMAIACIYRRGHVIHAGLMIDSRRILHVEEGVQTCAERVERFRIEGTYVPAGSITASV